MAGGLSNKQVWAGNKLIVEAPPPAIIAAAKLVRASPQDLEDVAFLMTATGLDEEAISEAVRHLPKEQREIASDNMVVLKLTARSRRQRVRQIQRQSKTGKGMND